MKFHLNQYKLKKTKFFLKKEKLVFFYNSINKNSNIWLKKEQEFKNYDINYYKLYNNLFLTIVKNSIFSFLLNLINGPIIFLSFSIYNKNNFDFLRSINVNLPLNLLCIKVKKNIYSVEQISKIRSLKYINNIFFLKIFIKIFIKLLVSLNFILVNYKKIFRNNVI
jgi:hypothetical protein